MQDKLNLKVTVIDYGMGNLRSVLNKVKDVVTNPILSGDPADIMNADRLILPGVGHYAQGIKNLEEMGLRAALEQRVLEDGIPILGICLGMQLFSEFSEEGDAAGLGWIQAKTVKFDKSKARSPHFKVPHMGWNTLNWKNGYGPVSEHELEDEFYFCHSYHMVCSNESDIVSTADYGYEVVASVRKGNIYGVQFHPEKSHDQGADMIMDFIRQAGQAAQAA